MSEQQINIKLYNTLSGQVEAFQTMDPAGKLVKLYVCGPTVYDDAHLGHARCYITWDVLYRTLNFMGYQVQYVRNVTDVDDKILNRAKERQETPAIIAERNYQSFCQDMQALNILPPSQEPHATQYIPHMLAGIEALISHGAAYATADGSVYFRVSAKPDYGKLSKKPLEDLKTGARVEVDPHKESPLDFALWKAIPASDPYGWVSPWPASGQTQGWGRPGWHMECSAMNYAVFGPQIDIHAGGADLIFPHHENEIAQSEAWSGQQPFARYWMHNGFVNVSGEKMSKSLGNFATIKTLLARYDANTIRYFLLTNGYRMPVDFNDEALQSAENAMNRLQKSLQAGLAQLQRTAEDISPLHSQDAAVGGPHFQHALEALANDLKTPAALADLNALANQVRALANPHAPTDKDHTDLFPLLQAALTLFDVLGLSRALLHPSAQQAIDLPTQDIHGLYQEMLGGTASQETAVTEQLNALLQLRKTAKAEKNWSTADAIRKQLGDFGLQMLDNKDGTTSVEKDGQEIVRI